MIAIAAYRLRNFYTALNPAALDAIC